MPRRRRSMSRRSSSRPRARRDWVYTDQGFLNGVFSQGAGQVNALAQPLIFSHNAERVIMFGSNLVLPAVPAYQGGYVKADPPDKVVYAVDGHAVYNPSAWAAGNDFIWGWRLLIYKMDPQTGSLESDPGYSMWASPVGISFINWRNSRDVLAEGRWYRSFGENTSNGSWVANIRWSSKTGRKLEEDEGLFLYLEGAVASVNSARNRLFVRTLVKAPAS